MTTPAFMSRRLELRAEMTRHNYIPRDFDPREMIPDETLRRFAKGEPGFICGEISEDLQRELSMLLPDICGQLLAYRLADDARTARGKRVAP